MEFSRSLNPEAQEFIPQRRGLLLQTHSHPFNFTNFFFPISAPVIGFHYWPQLPPPPYFSNSGHWLHQYHSYSTPPLHLLEPGTHRFSANTDFHHPPQLPPTPPLNHSEQSIGSQTSAEFERALEDQRPDLRAGNYTRIVEAREMVRTRKEPILLIDLGGDSTTVIIKNIPNACIREELIKFLDKHCKSVNEKAKDEGDDVIFSKYDFVYLPFDFRVDMTDQKWEMFKTNKIRQIAGAKYQGKMALMTRFEKTLFICDSDDFLPIAFEPARDGSGKAVTQKIIGKRLAPEEPESQLNQMDHF